MKPKIFITAFLLFSSAGASEAAASQAFEEKDYKSAIALYSALPEKKAEHFAAIAKSYYRDQEHEKAFRAYLEALDAAGETPHKMTDEEKEHFEKALVLFQDHSSLSHRENDLKIVQNYGPIVEKHPEFHNLALVVSASVATLGVFDQFFDLFLPAYKANPHHYISYKTRALLHLKLYERANTIEERNIQKQKILDNIAFAIERYPKDTSLYKMMVGFGDEKQVAVALNKIIDNNIIIPRVDILFFVQQAVEVKQYQLAQRFIDKAHEWYSVSRLLTSAQEYLNEHKLKNERQ